MTDLISTAVGGRIVACNDEFFAEASNLLKPSPPVSNDEYTDRGKWMDGWETRRRREPGHDWCVIALGIPGAIESVTVDTSFFTGNFPEAFSLEACGLGPDEDHESATWVELIPRTDLAGDSTATFPVADAHRVSLVRLNIYPDGGVARLRVEGRPVPARDLVCPEHGNVDLVSALVGGGAVDASDVHYSHPSNLLRPTDPAGMWDGWETKRRRGPGNDWAGFRLGLPGMVDSVVVDTRFFRGNSPGWVSVSVSEDGSAWAEIATRQPVSPDSVNVLRFDPVAASFLRLDIHPDGGVARLRVNGKPHPEVAVARRVEYLDSLFHDEARRFFHTACAATLWVEAMTEARPFPDAEAILATAANAFDDLAEEDWLEAFSAHPRIGERGDAMANREQESSSGASKPVIAELAEVNRAYEERYGFTYIVYATGKSAEEMLQIARLRLGNTREEEIGIAAGEQRAITETRLRRMLCMDLTS
jgi:allantoicase